MELGLAHGAACLAGGMAERKSRMATSTWPGQWVDWGRCAVLLGFARGLWGFSSLRFRRLWQLFLWSLVVLSRLWPQLVVSFFGVNVTQTKQYSVMTESMYTAVDGIHILTKDNRDS
jgi:hypothetical protein